MQSILKRTSVVILAVVLVLTQFLVYKTPTPTYAATSYSDGYGDFLYALGARESGNSYSARNGSYLGRWQLGTGALQDAGFMTSSGSWTSLAASYGVTSTATFLSSQAGQDYAVLQYHKKLWAYLKSNGASAYVGKTYKDITVTMAAVIGAAHLVGPGAVKSMLANGSSASDGSGVTAYSYMKLLGSYDISATITGTASSVSNVAKDPAPTTTEAVTEATTEEETEEVTKYDAERVINYGDVNKDGTINSIDATFVLSYYAECLTGLSDMTCEEYVSEILNSLKSDEAETVQTTEEESVETNETETAPTTEETENGTVAAQQNNDTEETVSETTSETESIEETTETLEEISKIIGDLNGDGSVNSIDAVSVLVFYAESLVGKTPVENKSVFYQPADIDDSIVSVD
jgi:hypothetical protein